MAKIAVSLKIDVTKIDKARLFNGAKGKYLDATIFIELDEFDQYGNSGMITQDVSKEEKQQNVKGNILGNGKVFWKEEATQQGGYQNQPNPTYQKQAPARPMDTAIQQNVAHNSAAKVNPQEPTIEFDDDLPF